MATKHKLLTAEEFFQKYAHEDGRYELVKGRVIEMTPPGGIHGAVVVNITGALWYYLREHPIGRLFVESGFILERRPDTVRGPDVSFVITEHLPTTGVPKAFFEGTPDLAIEVVSPSNTAAQVNAKVREYLRNGAQQVWVAYPDERAVAVHHKDGRVQRYEEGDALEGDALLPEFTLVVREVFAL
jgi:Uma2 family endonuclease